MTDKPTHWPWEIPQDTLWEFGKRNEEEFRRLTTLIAEGPLYAAQAFRDALRADKWELVPLYPEHEDVHVAFKGTREGFIVLGIARPARAGHLPAGNISLYGPGGNFLRAPLVYPGFRQIKKLVP